MVDGDKLAQLQRGPLPADREIMSMSGAGQPLTWALVIATYQRPDMLLRCLRLAVQQTRPPRELVIIDASPNWKDVRDQARTVAARSSTHCVCIYEPAIKRSS